MKSKRIISLTILSVIFVFFSIHNYSFWKETGTGLIFMGKVKQAGIDIKDSSFNEFRLSVYDDCIKMGFDYANKMVLGVSLPAYSLFIWIIFLITNKEKYKISKKFLLLPVLPILFGTFFLGNAQYQLKNNEDVYLGALLLWQIIGVIFFIPYAIIFSRKNRSRKNILAKNKSVLE